MSKRTIIYLHTLEPVQASWIVFENDIPEQSMLRCTLADIPPAIKQYDITLIVPAQDILLTQADLPKLNQQRLLQALPFALEEKLIDEVDTLHFAIANNITSGLTPAAVVAKKNMDAWLTLCNEFELVPSSLYSAVFALPYAEKNWTVGIESDTCTIRQTEFTGFATEQNNLVLLLDLAIKETSAKPECIHIYNTQTALPEINIESTVVNEIALTEQAFLEKIPLWLDAQPAINLLQGQYRAKRKTSEIKKIWLRTGYLALLWIGLVFFSNLVSFFILHHETTRQNGDITAIYKKNFPNAVSMVAPRERMESKLAALTNQANKNYFLVLLAKVSETFAHTSGLHLKSMDFRDDRLNLELTAAKFDDLDNFNKTLTQQGLKVKQQNASITGTEVKANFLIQRGAS
jgi:general secretion pathway protein L